MDDYHYDSLLMVWIITTQKLCIMGVWNAGTYHSGYIRRMGVTTELASQSKR